MKLTEKKKKILCIIGIVCLVLVGLYGATRKQINELITQHKLNSSVSSSTNSLTNQKETVNKSTKQKIKIAYKDVCEAIYNTRTLEGRYNWQYTDTSDDSKSGSAGKYANYNESRLYANTSNTIEKQRMLDKVYDLLMNRKSATGGKYDMIVGDIGKNLHIIAFIPGLNITTDNEGIVTSISYCSSIANESEPISYETYSYEKYLDTFHKYAYEMYVPQFTYTIDIAKMMKDLNYKSSEFDVSKDFTIENQNTDIEIYSYQIDDFTLKLEYTSKTGVITTIKFN